MMSQNKRYNIVKNNSEVLIWKRNLFVWLPPFSEVETDEPGNINFVHLDNNIGKCIFNNFS